MSVLNVNQYAVAAKRGFWLPG